MCIAHTHALAMHMLMHMFISCAAQVEYTYANDASKVVHREEYDTVLMATGRTACVDDLSLDVVGVRLANGKVLVDEEERTTVGHIYAIGDVATGVKQREETYMHAG